MSSLCNHITFKNVSIKIVLTKNTYALLSNMYFINSQLVPSISNISNKIDKKHALLHYILVRKTVKRNNRKVIKLSNQTLWLW